jgi:hypothetical protein
MQRLWNVVIICIATVLPACVDSSAGLAPETAEPGNAALETAAAPAEACTTFAGTWQTNADTFAAAIAPAAKVNFSFRADGVTRPPVGAAVARDEFLSCCGILLDFIGGPPRGGGLFWIGSDASGFAIKSRCRGTSDDCGRSGGGVRITFVPAVTAAGLAFPADDTAVMFDAQNTPISTMSGSGFLGYQSAVPIDHAEFKDSGGEILFTLIYHRCL